MVGVCSGKNAELVRALGADEVVDYTKEDFTQRPDLYDVIFDTVGKTELDACLPLLRSGGSYLLTVFGPREVVAMLRTRLFGDKRVIGIATNWYWKSADLELLAELAAEGALKPVIDRTYPLEQAADAHRYVEQGHKVGNVVLTV